MHVCDWLFIKKNDNVDEIKNQKTNGNNKIVDAETQEGARQCCQKWKTEGAEIVAGDLVGHYKSTTAKTDHHVGKEIYLAAIFRIHEQKRYSITGCKMPADKTKHQNPENNQHRIFLHLNQY